MNKKDVTISSIFLVPTLDIDKDKLREFGFVNGYIRDKSRENDYKDVIYLLFHPPDMDLFMKLIDNEYERNGGIIEDYDYEGGWVVLIYILNDDFQKDFNLIKKGKYSHTSEEFQKLFPETVKVEKHGSLMTETSIQYRIFNKTQDLRLYWEKKLGFEFREDMEVWRGWDEEREILDIDKIKELV